MKKLVVAMAAVAAASSLFAAPVGNPSAPQLIEEGFFISRDSWVDLRAGYEGDFVSDGRLKQYKHGSGRVDSFAQDTNAGTVTLNILDRLDLYALFGSSRVRSEWRFNTGGGANIADLETLYNFLWGLGARGILFEWGAAALGLGGRYEHANYSNVWLTINGSSTPANGTHLKWREWQIDLDLSYKIDIFTPYIGVKYSSAKSNVGTFGVPIASDGSGTNQFENRTPVGVFIGCTLSTGKYFMLNVEGRLVDEEAVTISGDVRF